MINTLKRFGHMSSLNINIQKSRLIVPKTLHHKLQKILSRSVHIPVSTAFGLYLGIPLVPLKPKPKDYEELLLKFSKHLAGWQTNFLNFAGRATLIKSTLSSLPVYHMQATLLPPKLLNLWNKSCIDSCGIKWDMGIIVHKLDGRLFAYPKRMEDLG